MNNAAIAKIQIYDNSSLLTSSNYVMLRAQNASYQAVQTTFSGWITSTGVTTQIGHFEISAVEPRLPFTMEVGGIAGTSNSGEKTFATGALKAGYSLTGLTGFRFTTTGTDDIGTGRFTLYGLSQ